MFSRFFFIRALGDQITDLNLDWVHIKRKNKTIAVASAARMCISFQRSKNDNIPLRDNLRTGIHIPDNGYAGFTFDNLSGTQSSSVKISGTGVCIHKLLLYCLIVLNLLFHDCFLFTAILYDA